MKRGGGNFDKEWITVTEREGGGMGGNSIK